MKHLLIYPTTIAVLVAGGAFKSATAVAVSRCDNPTGTLEQRVCAKAAEGPDALRRFVARTASIYALSYFDFARGDATSPATNATTKP